MSAEECEYGRVTVACTERRAVALPDGSDDAGRLFADFEIVPAIETVYRYGKTPDQVRDRAWRLL